MKNPLVTAVVAVRPSRAFLSCLLVSVVTSAAYGQAMTRVMDTPLRAAVTHADEVTTRLSLDDAAYQSLKGRAEVRISGFSLGAAHQVDLDLERMDVFAPHARIVLVTKGGEVEVPRPDVLLLRGTVVGRDESRVFLSLSPHGTNGWIEFDGERFVISSGPKHSHDAVVYDYGIHARDKINWKEWTCGQDESPAHPHGHQRKRKATRSAKTIGPEAGSALFHVQIAIDTDFEFTNDVFGGNMEAASAYAATIVGAMSQIYARDVRTDFTISFLRLWETSDDPWDEPGGSIESADQFRDYWIANMTGVSRHLAHRLSGKEGQGGRGWVGVLCDPVFGYSTSTGLTGFFPLPLEENSSLNWDIFVVAHEVGHNFGAPHTRAKNPPLDACGLGPPCSVPTDGTMMSACMDCPGGYSNVALRFHETIILEDILPHLAIEAGCVPSTGPATLLVSPQDVTTCTGNAVELSVGVGGAALEYQWRKDGADLPSGTTKVMTLDPLGPEDTGLYDVVVTNAGGTGTSDAAVVTSVDCTFAPSGPSGCRALRVADSDLGIDTHVAFDFLSPDRPCLSGFLSVDGDIVSEPEFRSLEDWSTLLILGADIVPDTAYGVRMNFGTASDPRWTMLTETRTEVWGDTAGPNVQGVWTAPDGVVQTGDILAGIACFTGAPGAPPFERCDLVPAIPDGSIDIADVLRVVSGFQGLPYPFARPPCPAARLPSASP